MNPKLSQALAFLQESLNGDDEWVVFLHRQLGECQTFEQTLELLKSMQKDISFAQGFLRQAERK